LTPDTRRNSRRPEILGLSPLAIEAFAIPFRAPLISSVPDRRRDRCVELSRAARRGVHQEILAALQRAEKEADVSSHPLPAFPQVRSARRGPPSELTLFRQCHDLLLTEVALAVPISANLLSRIERGLVEPPAGLVEHIKRTIKTVAEARGR
jgi:hypothetical protein